MRRLNVEISSVLKWLGGSKPQQSKLETAEIPEPESDDKSKPVQDQRTPPASEWNQSQVETWLNQKSVSRTIKENVTPCDGKILNQIYLMLCDAPEFFYRSISSPDSTHISTRDLAQFAYELKSLFKN